MKDFLKYAFGIAVCGTFAYICTTVRDCGTVGDSPDRVIIPSDSGYSPIVIHDYRPKSTPFEKPVKPVSNLPKGTREKDVKRVFTVNDIAGRKMLQIIETKNGDVHVPKNGSSFEIVVTNYRSPIFEFGLFPGVGVSYSGSVSPAAVVGVAKIFESTVFPAFIADLNGVGIGVSSQIYYDLHIGSSVQWKYNDMSKMISLNVTYFF